MKIKKIISLCLIFLITISSFPSFGAVIETSDSMKVLQAMEVLSGDPDGNMRPDDLVKRSEFAKMAVLLSEYKTLVAKDSKISVFSDCTASHWAAPYVKVAAEKGMINGYSSGKFGPDDNITYAQAVTIALRLLGYEDADFGFSYPEGQLGMAISLKLNSGIAKGRDDFLTRKDVSVILTNTLSAKPKDGTGEYIAKLGYSFGEDVIVVASNEDTPAVLPGKVYTSGGEYSINDSFDLSLVGTKGTALTDSDNNLVAVIPGGGTAVRYAVLTAGSELVSVYANGSTITLDCSDDTVCYDKTEKTTFGRIKTSLSIGDIITIGKTSGGGIDYIVVHKSDFSGPHTVSSDGVVPSDGDFGSFSVLRNGSRSDLSSIKKNDILYISNSLSCIFVYNKKVSGIYSKATPNIDSPESVTVGGKEYKIESAKAFSKLCSASGYSIGDNIVLLLGRGGGVADVITEKEETASSFSGEYTEEENVVEPHVALMNSLGAIGAENGIIPQGESTITRGEFAKMAVMSSKYRTMVSVGTKLSIFSDVTQNYWATPYIKIAVEKSLMSAYPDSKFYPENPVTLADALTIALKILGYSDSDFSDWPSSQMAIASSKGITKGVEKGAYDYVSKNEAAQIVYNTLCTVSKDSKSKGIELAGYEYYEDAVLMATNAENSSVPSGRILTSAGTFSIDETSFDKTLLGKSGQLLIYSGKVNMFNKNSGKYIEKVIYSAVPGGLAVMEKDSIEAIDVPDTATVYASGTKMSYSNASSSVALGDTAQIYYDNQNRLKYVYISTDSLEGPFVATGSAAWYVSVPQASKESKIMKDGREVDASQIASNDILYYSPALDIVFVYGKRIVGILEDASPSMDAPETITVSGTSYTLETGNAFAIGATYGDMVAICLGRNGRVASSYKAHDMNLVGYLVSTGIKEFKNSAGDPYTSVYARLVLPDGTYIDCATDADYENWINQIMSVSFSEKGAKLSKNTSSGQLGGKVDAQNLTIGNAKVASDVKILDVGYNETSLPTVYKNIYLQRLDGVNLLSSKILYCKKENGVVKELILNNVTGDVFSYGIVTSAISNSEGFSASGSYTIDVGSQSYTYSGGYISGLKKGSIVQVAISGGRCVDIDTVGYTHETSVKEITHTNILLKNGETFKISEDVAVYKLIGNSDYSVISLSEAVENYKNYSHISFKADNSTALGGRVRVIVVK